MSDNECLLFSLYCCTLLSFSLPFSVVESGRIEKPKQSTAVWIRYKSDDWHTYWLPDWLPDWHTFAVRDMIDRPDWLTYGLTSDCRLAVKFWLLGCLSIRQMNWLSDAQFSRDKCTCPTPHHFQIVGQQMRHSLLLIPHLTLSHP